MAEIEVYTGRYEREHQRKPAGIRFWRFTLTSPSITAKDHVFAPEQAMSYPSALQKAKAIAELRKSVRIIVEP